MPIKIKRLLIAIPLLFWCLVTFADTTAEQAIQLAELAKQTDAAESKHSEITPAPVIEVKYTKKGADTCIKCHDEDSDVPVLNIFKSKHGQVDDKRTPFAGLQCETCHGPGSGARNGHAGKVRPGQERPHILSFGAKSSDSVETQNGMCLACHQGGDHIGWQGSKHGGNDLACANCHTVHTADDPVIEKKTQAAVCYKCHTDKRADFYKPSSHPVRAAQMACSDCHSPHGGSTDTQLRKSTLNQTCYTCHAEKRGPFLWEHAPVAEDCSLCHTPHGSVHTPLLTKRAPLLCQQCHSKAGHPSVGRTASGLPSGTASAFLLSGSCLNCHSQIHGSNHPSGVKLMR